MRVLFFCDPKVLLRSAGLSSLLVSLVWNIQAGHFLGLMPSGIATPPFLAVPSSAETTLGIRPLSWSAVEETHRTTHPGVGLILLQEMTAAAALFKSNFHTPSSASAVFSNVGASGNGRREFIPPVLAVKGGRVEASGLTSVYVEMLFHLLSSLSLPVLAALDATSSASPSAASALHGSGPRVAEGSRSPPLTARPPLRPEDPRHPRQGSEGGGGGGALRAATLVWQRILAAVMDALEHAPKAGYDCI